MGFNSGLILSQLDGDGHTGYDKPGLRLGIRSQAYISKNVDLIIELNWEEKGSRFESGEADENGKKNQVIRLDYAEVPFILRFYGRKRQSLFLEAGTAISYLVSYKFFGPQIQVPLERYQMVAQDFRRSEINAILGGGYAFTARFGLVFRTSIAINHLYHNAEVIDQVAKLPQVERNNPDVPLALLRNYLVSVGAYFLL
jgi:hypothetical protein